MLITNLNKVHRRTQAHQFRNSQTASIRKRRGQAHRQQDGSNRGKRGNRQHLQRDLVNHFQTLV